MTSNPKKDGDRMIIRYLLATALLHPGSLGCTGGSCTHPDHRHRRLQECRTRYLTFRHRRGQTKVNNRDAELTSLTRSRATESRSPCSSTTVSAPALAAKSATSKNFITSLPAGTEILVGYMQNGRVVPSPGLHHRSRRRRARTCASLWAPREPAPAPTSASPTSSRTGLRAEGAEPQRPASSSCSPMESTPTTAASAPMNQNSTLRRQRHPRRPARGSSGLLHLLRRRRYRGQETPASAARATSPRSPKEPVDEPTSRDAATRSPSRPSSTSSESPSRRATSPPSTHGSRIRSRRPEVLHQPSRHKAPRSTKARPGTRITASGQRINP